MILCLFFDLPRACALLNLVVLLFASEFLEPMGELGLADSDFFCPYVNFLLEMQFVAPPTGGYMGATDLPHSSRLIPTK